MTSHYYILTVKHSSNALCQFLKVLYKFILLLLLLVKAANIVPSIQISDKQDLSETEKVQCKSAQANLSEEIQQEEADPEDIFQKVDLSGISDWDLKIQQEAQDLIHEYACIFS